MKYKKLRNKFVLKKRKTSSREREWLLKPSNFNTNSKLSIASHQLQNDSFKTKHSLFVIELILIDKNYQHYQSGVSNLEFKNSQKFGNNPLAVWDKY
ncbi:hypothetical protein BpHYR1_042285 [Brachionus plicatilis]|uniref:Uncharacterized protein n=1 Tax=Brachionus plicatilis TaxID=10195 RepID=A0A3M7R5K2_BRAPC|nr:hypothetical protein BpHYR1_042285 [Brachionus plicatilis]